MLGHSAARARRPLLVIAAILMAAGGLVSGIGVGDKVAVQGAGFLNDGDLVRIAATAATAKE